MQQLWKNRQNKFIKHSVYIKNMDDYTHGIICLLALKHPELALGHPQLHLEPYT